MYASKMSRHGVAGLTRRQQIVLDFMRGYLADHGHAPTIREVMDGLGIKSSNGVLDHLKALERKGYLCRGGGTARTMKVLRDASGRPLLSPAEQIEQLQQRVAELEAELAALKGCG